MWENYRVLNITMSAVHKGYYKDKYQTFSGERTVDALKQFVEEYIRIWHISVEEIDYSESEEQEIDYLESEEQDYSESEDKQAAIASLNLQSFVYALYSGELWIVKFFKPGCGYCKAFAPTYLEFGQQMKKHQYLNVGELSCSNYSSICTSQGVFGVPTVKLYYNDDEAEFYGERTVKGLKKFVKKYIKIWQINIEDYEDEDEKDNKQIYKIVFIISAGIIVVLANIILIVFIRKRQKRTSSKQNREISNEYAKLPLEPVDNSTNLMPSD
ncbi:MAG: hypothetical protein EZS28_037881 [Streblomastix strix]|uniref:Thioredoxin domain-containing protein n=1 Tax=Streblomastix strix TaxID=222440 RepID=A0A5J4U8Q4_9EUKA|nr:MAG: hypothetical protein EZS28_037881 [Streblomastix strix]